MDINNLKLLIAEYVMFYLLTVFFILGERLFLRYLKFNLSKKLYLEAHPKNNVTKVLIYGGGINTRFYLSKKYLNITEDPIKVIGLIDDELVLRKQYVYNCKVFGLLHELPNVFEKYKFDKVVITSENISIDKRSYLENFCTENGIDLVEILFLTKNIC